MGTPLRIAVLTHEFDNFEKDGYLLAKLAPEWTAEGAEVLVVSGTPDQIPRADVAILHTNLTEVPEEYLGLCARYPVVINRDVTNISKRIVSDVRITRPEEYDGPVIVKTAANFGGRPEYRHSQLRGDFACELPSKNWDQVRFLNRYPLCRTTKFVPKGVWDNPNLIVDRFVPEMNAAREYVLRVWIFLGDQDLHYTSVSAEPIIKSSNTLRRDLLPSEAVPDVLRERRRTLGFDYGKFDYVQIDGQVLLLDANRTPGFGNRDAMTSERQERFRQLARGLEPFVAQARASA
jgi:hypothetical protein